MDDMLILYVAVGVFTLMLIGLGLTVWEFRTNIIVTPKHQADLRQKPAALGSNKPHLRRVA